MIDRQLLCELGVDRAAVSICGIANKDAVEDRHRTLILDRATRAAGRIRAEHIGGYGQVYEGLTRIAAPRVPGPDSLPFRSVNPETEAVIGALLPSVMISVAPAPSSAVLDGHFLAAEDRYAASERGATPDRAAAPPSPSVSNT